MLTKRSLSADFPHIVYDLDRDVATCRRRSVLAEDCYLQGRVADTNFRQGASIPRADTGRYRMKDHIVVWFWGLSHGDFSMLRIRAGTVSIL